MESKEFNYKGKNFSIRWDPKDQMIFIETWGKHDKAIAEMFMTKFGEFYKRFSTPESAKILVENVKLIKTDHEARRAYTEQVKIFPGSGMIAVCGANTIIRIVCNFLLSNLIKRKNTKVKFFTTSVEGLKWLKK